MIAFRPFDIIDSFAIDYMHGVALGVTKLLMCIWLGEKRLSAQIVKFFSSESCSVNCSVFETIHEYKAKTKKYYRPSKFESI